VRIYSDDLFVHHPRFNARVFFIAQNFKLPLPLRYERNSSTNLLFSQYANYATALGEGLDHEKNREHRGWEESV
jgi:hypothetical protein